MRVATMNAFDRGLSTLQKRQSEMAAMQEQLTSGKRVQRASDDPADAARAERADQIRDELQSQGVILEDSRAGTSWKRD